MQVLTVDVGTGTQDIFLYDSDLDLENGYKMVVPSPTMMFHRRIRRATREGRRVLLTGVLMGGGPVSWAAGEHVRAGYPLYATPAAARTFDDDLEKVQKKMGVTVVSEDEAASLVGKAGPPGLTSGTGKGQLVHLELKDFDYAMIAGAFEQFGYPLEPDAVAVAVFDHGHAPPGCSDRRFRFDYLDQRIREHNRLSAFAYRAEDLPAAMTRLQAVVESAQGLDLPVMVMDTAPAAVLGACLDPRVAELEQVLLANLGNFHCLVFRLGPPSGEHGARGIEGFFEHHTGEVTPQRLDELIDGLAGAKLAFEEVFNDKGHGALVYDSAPMVVGAGQVVVTGPRRSMMRDGRHRPYFAVPYGDMMLAGCFGMLRALADVYPEFAGPILASLSGAAGRAPWENG